jgi:hypothetical protein
MTALIPKDAFIGIENVAHLAAGGEAPPLREHVAAAAEFLGDKAAGMPGGRACTPRRTACVRGSRPCSGARPPTSRSWRPHPMAYSSPL